MEKLLYDVYHLSDGLVAECVTLENLASDVLAGLGYEFYTEKCEDGLWALYARRKSHGDSKFERLLCVPRSWSLQDIWEYAIRLRYAHATFELIETRINETECARLYDVAKITAAKVMASPRTLRQKINYFEKIGLTYLQLHLQSTDRNEKKLYKAIADMYERRLYKLLEVDVV